MEFPDILKYINRTWVRFSHILIEIFDQTLLKRHLGKILNLSQDDPNFHTVLHSFVVIFVFAQLSSQLTLMAMAMELLSRTHHHHYLSWKTIKAEAWRSMLQVISFWNTKGLFAWSETIHKLFFPDFKRANIKLSTEKRHILFNTNHYWQWHDFSETFSVRSR